MQTLVEYVVARLAAGRSRADFWSGLQTTEGKKSPNWLDHDAGRSCKQRQVPLLAE